MNPNQTIDYIQTLNTGVIHISRPHANTAFCGTALIGRIRPITKPKTLCPDCERANT